MSQNKEWNQSVISLEDFEDQLLEQNSNQNDEIELNISMNKQNTLSLLSRNHQYGNPNIVNTKNCTTRILSSHYNICLASV